MRKFLKKMLSLTLTGALAASLSAPAFASNALGQELTGSEVQLHQQTKLATNVFWSEAYSDLRTENYITYRPDGNVRPIITFGDYLTQKSTVTAQAKTLESQGYRVVAGINGDYYNTGTGLPVGIVVTEGQLRSTDAGVYALGFTADGNVVMGKPQVQINADMGYMLSDSSGYATQVLRRITAVNKARVSNGGIYLYTYDFNDRHTTGNTEAGVDVVCTIAEGSIAIGETVTLIPQQIIEAASATPIAPDQVVLSTNLKSGDYHTTALRNIPLGNPITLTITASDEKWNDVEYAVGALYMLAENGVINPELPTGVNPRTAVGRKPSGELIFYTVDGRKSGHSVGASLTQVAERLMELGCRDIVAMDGGGSTTLAITEPSDVTASCINTPSDGSQRKVSNQIFLVAPNTPSGILSHFYLDTDHDFVLGGSKVTLDVSGVDTNYIPMDVGYSLSASAGQLSGNVLTTPNYSGTVTVRASGNGRSGSTAIEVVNAPSEITVLRNGSAIESIEVSPGSSTKLAVTAKYDRRSLYLDPDAIQWAVDEDLGTITEDGVFTAGRPGEGQIRVTLGSKTKTINVKISRLYLEEVEDFENGASAFDSGYGENAQFALAGGEGVRIGYGAGRLSYALTEEWNHDAAWRTSDSAPMVAAPYSGVSMWVKGDGSGNELKLLYSDGTANGLETLAATLDFTGWQQILVPFAGDRFEIQGFKVSAPRTAVADDGITTIWEYADTARTGTVYIDQIMASYDSVVDSEVPVITTNLDLENGILTAQVLDAEDDLLAKEAIAVKCSVGAVKGVDVPFEYNAKTGDVTVTLPQDQAAVGAMRITITARDASGNIGRASVDMDSYDVEHKFTDIKNYWGAKYVDFLYNVGVTTGYTDGTFRPNQNITRAQFAAMLYRYLGLKEEDYAEVELPFADLDKIQEYALPAIRALYTEGVINGTTGKDGQLYFNPNNNLTRAQAATMIGRTQEKGYALVDLTFTDSAKIPAYATFYIQTMAAQGIIGGYTDGTFRPNNNITRGQMAKILYNLM